MKSTELSKLYTKGSLNAEQLEIRELALNSLEVFIRLVAPYQLLGKCHVELCRWAQKNEAENKLILWPRDHGKSRFAAFYTAWNIVRDPAITIMYASATAEKAEEQLRFIKDILVSPTVTKYFPELINDKEGQRKAWNATNIIVDHPHRVNEGVVDSTVMTCGLDKTITGKHCKIFVFDDIVVKENNTAQGRKDVNGWVAQAASIMSAESHVFAVGTRYHPKDAYDVMINMSYQIPEGENGELMSDPKSLFVVNQADVEHDGEFLWPRQQRKDGKWFGFNAEILARKKAIYEAASEITQFYSQYYNNPNDKSTSPIAAELFQYYEREKLHYSYGSWEIEGRPMYLYAAIDLAATAKETSDYTAIAVGGIDTLGNRYTVQLDRLRTDKTSPILARIMELYDRYHFKKLRIEAVGGFRLVAKDMAEYLNSKGIRIPIDIYVPPNTEGKNARVNGILEPLYQVNSVYHYRGGNVQALEDELVSANPPHDDMKDSWAMCCDLMAMPRTRVSAPTNVVRYHPRFGGVAL